MINLVSSIVLWDERCEVEENGAAEDKTEESDYFKDYKLNIKNHPYFHVIVTTFNYG